jgi:hypothetical protein
MLAENKSSLAPFTAFTVRRNDTDRLRRCHNPNTLVLTTQAVQVFVARDDQIGVRRNGGGDHLIVIGIIHHHALDAARLHHMSEALVVAQQGEAGVALMADIVFASFFLDNTSASSSSSARLV